MVAKKDTFQVAIPGMTPAAYAANDLMGSCVQLADADATKTVSGIIDTAVLYDQAGNEENADIILFDQEPVNTTFTDNEPLDIHDDDAYTVAGYVPMSVHCQMASSSFATYNDANIAFRLRSGTGLYAAAVTRGTPTVGAATDLLLKLGIIED